MPSPIVCPDVMDLERRSWRNTTTSSPIKLGVIGCGRHALRSHIKVALRLPDLYSVTLLYDLNQAAAEKIIAECGEAGLSADKASASGMRFVSSADELLASPEVDAVLIATPPDSHLAYLEEAIKREKNVICEKPVWNGTVETDRATDLIVTARHRSLVLTSCHPRRFEPPFIEVKRRLKKWREELGELREILFRFFYHVPPKGGWRETDSLLLDHMNHEIDLVNFLIGKGPADFRKDFDSFDCYSVSGQRLEKGGPVIRFSGYRKLDTKVYRNELELVFDRGRVLVVSILLGELVRSTVIVSHFDRSGFGLIPLVVYDAYHSVELPFEGIMRNFAKVMGSSGENYLEMDDLYYNNALANLLAERGEVKGFYA